MGELPSETKGTNVRTVEEKILLIRAYTRAAAFLIPLIALCVALFTLMNVRDTIVGAVMGCATTAGIFYFKKSEEES